MSWVQSLYETCWLLSVSTLAHSRIANLTLLSVSHSTIPVALQANDLDSTSAIIMINDETYRQAGVPTTLLDCPYKRWRMDHLRAVLEHYGRSWRYRASKLELMSELHRLVQERQLTSQDKSRILTARKSSLIGGDPVPPESAARLDCVVCFEGLGPTNAPQRKIASACDHEANVCLSCLSQSIATQFASKVWDQINCPSCSARLEHQDVRAFADAEVFERWVFFAFITYHRLIIDICRYDNFSLEGLLSSAQFQRCRHPNCRSGQECYAEHDSFMICQECHGRTCITCDTIWHPDVSCADVAARHAEAQRVEEAAATEYLTTNVKLCPRCNVRGEKVSGCDHMTCRTYSHNSYTVYAYV